MPTAPLELQAPQSKNVDEGFVHILLSDTADKYELSPGYKVEGIQEAPIMLEVDSAENKTEGYITALYGRIFKGTTSLKLGKVPLVALEKMVGAHLIQQAGSAKFRVRKTAQLPFLAARYISKWVSGLEGQARLWMAHRKMKITSLAFQVFDQDNFATVDLSFTTIFSVFPIGGGEEMGAIIAEKSFADLADSTVYPPTRVPLPLWAPKAKQGFDRIDNSDIIQSVGWGSSTVGDHVSFDCFLHETTILDLVAQKGAGHGKATITFDGENLGIVDFYDASELDNQRIQVLLSIPEAKHGALKITISENNPSSSGDLLELGDVQLLLGAATPTAEVNTLPRPVSNRLYLPASAYSQASSSVDMLTPGYAGAEKVEIDGLGEYLEFEALLEPGTYKLSPVAALGADHGIVTLTADGTTVGTADLDGNETPKVRSIPETFEVAEHKIVKMRLTVSGTANSGHKAVFAAIHLDRTESVEDFVEGETAQAAKLYLPWFADAATGWTGAADTGLRNWSYTSDGTSGRKFVWNKDQLVPGTYRATLVCKTDTGKPDILLKHEAETLATFVLDEPTEANARIVEEFTITASVFGAMSLEVATAAAASVRYLIVEQIA